MSDTEKTDFPSQVKPPFRRMREFEDSLEEARALFDDGKLDASLQVLEQLEQEYVRGVEIFDLMGDVFIGKGDLERGARYKTLHNVLAGTYRITGEEQKIDQPEWPAEQRYQGPGIPPKPRQGEADPQRDTTEKPGAGKPTVKPGSLFPLTAQMGREFMRLQEYERAIEVFEVLLDANPDDDAIRAEYDLAVRRNRDKAVLHVLQGWLSNVDKMRNELHENR